MNEKLKKAKFFDYNLNFRRIFRLVFYFENENRRLITENQ